MFSSLKKSFSRIGCSFFRVGSSIEVASNAFS